MKHQPEKNKKEKKFLKMPSYPGGNEAFKKFVEENLRYPEEALKAMVEGTVYLEYSVDNLGRVADEKIIHGVGHGCDEEAMRIVRMLEYNPVNNHGVRVKITMKTRIRFELPSHLKPQPQVSYTYSTPAPSSLTNKKPEPPASYGYTITI